MEADEIISFLAGFIGQNGSFVIGCGFTYFKGYGIGRANGQAVAQAVAVIVSQQGCLAVHHAYGLFVAGLGAETAAVTFFLIYSDYFA